MRGSGRPPPPGSATRAPETATRSPETATRAPGGRALTRMGEFRGCASWRGARPLSPRAHPPSPRGSRRRRPLDPQQGPAPPHLSVPPAPLRARSVRARIESRLRESPADRGRCSQGDGGVAVGRCCCEATAFEVHVTVCHQIAGVSLSVHENAWSPCQVSSVRTRPRRREGASVPVCGHYPGGQVRREVWSAMVLTAAFPGV